MIAVAPVLALACGLAVRTLAPRLYGWLFPSLPIHREWCDAIGWLGVIFVLVPLVPTWRFMRGDRAAGHRS